MCTELSQKHANRQMPITRKLLDGAVQAIFAKDLYFIDRADPVFMFTREKAIRLTDLMMAIVCHLIQRRVICQTMEYCAECESLGGSVTPVDCKVGFEQHKQCRSGRLPSLNQVKAACLGFLDTFPGLVSIMEDIIKGEELDLDAANCIQWIQEMSVTPESIQLELARMEKHCPSVAFLFVDPELLERACNCYY